MNYTEKDREIIVERSKNINNYNRGINMAMVYSMYDIMRLQLEELHRIGNAVESILEIIQKEEENPLKQGADCSTL